VYCHKQPNGDGYTHCMRMNVCDVTVNPWNTVVSRWKPFTIKNQAL